MLSPGRLALLGIAIWFAGLLFRLTVGSTGLIWEAIPLVLVLIAIIWAAVNRRRDRRHFEEAGAFTRGARRDPGRPSSGDE